jgi:hypothetical protein
MSTKTDKPKTKDENQERFYRFAKALIAVPKKELDKEPREIKSKSQEKHK